MDILRFSLLDCSIGIFYYFKLQLGRCLVRFVIFSLWCYSLPYMHYLKAGRSIASQQCPSGDVLMY